MYCKYCGSKIEDNTIFCGHCGRQLLNHRHSVNSVDQQTANVPSNNQTNVTSQNIKGVLFKFGIYISTGICIFMILLPFLNIFSIPIMTLWREDITDIPPNFSVIDYWKIMNDYTEKAKYTADVELDNTNALTIVIYGVPYIISVVSLIILLWLLITKRPVTKEYRLMQWNCSIICSACILLCCIYLYYTVDNMEKLTKMLHENKLVELNGTYGLILLSAFLNLFISIARRSNDKFKFIKAEKNISN